MILMGIILIALFIVILAVGSGLSGSKERRKQQQEMQSLKYSPAQKPVVLIIIDSLMHIPLKEVLDFGKAPAMKYLVENGQYHPKVVTSFPTMSVSIDTTLLTGATPNEHHIYGLVYFHKKENRIVNFGTGFKETFIFGLKTVLQDSLLNLNQKYISQKVKTIHEETDLPTASINGLIYRGNYQRTLFPPLLARWTALLPKRIQTKAPFLFSFGAMSKISKSGKYDSLWRRFGFNDSFSRKELASLIKKGHLPAFTIAYFPTNDDAVHREGPSQIKGIEKADKELQKVLDAFGSWEEAIRQVTWIVMGDSGQTPILPNHQAAYIDLRKLLSDYKIMPIRQKTPRKEDQLVLCVNERMAYIYLTDPDLKMNEVVQALKKEPKLDLIAWQEKDWIHVISGNVPEARCRFQKEGPYADEYGQTWKLEGDLSVLDLKPDESNRIRYGIFPDVLFRLSGVMNTWDRVIIVTASPGYELTGEGSPTHKGGSHGSLHYLDSEVPMIICGTNSKPETLRLIDIKDWILQLISSDETNL